MHASNNKPLWLQPATMTTMYSYATYTSAFPAYGPTAECRLDQIYDGGRPPSGKIHVWFHRIGLIISAARKDRACKSYTDLGTKEHNKICTQDVP